ncbi:putative glycoprotein [Cytorhabdovirus caricae]|uniref:Putative glycoprotein n=1 Tax=Cytorhabdovirus caricae TaxID=2364291 RepID=A0A386GXU3_9RHAB|nr:putative glycoprotein [Cytorhabdovirus caricae]AYD37623.1 putative glycoprotein [Cytorhabdovirus caricae]
MSGYAIVMMILLCSMKTRSEFSHHILPAPIICGEQFPTSEYNELSCMSSCSLENFAGEPFNITLYDQLHDTSIVMAYCKKVRMQQTFTKTWSFSTFASDLSVVPLSPTFDECKMAWDSKCKDSECLVKPDPIVPAYYYAASHEVVQEGIVIEAHKYNTVVKVKAEDQIMIGGEFRPYAKGSLYMQDKMTWVMWNPKAEEKCELAPTVSTQCIFTVKGMLNCDALGIVINASSAVSATVCGQTSGVLIDNLGIVFRFGHFGRNFKTPSFPITRIDSADAIEELIMAVQLSSQVLKSETCVRSCLSHDGTKVLEDAEFFGDRIVSNRSGVLKLCRYQPTCKLMLPIRICFGTSLVRVKCGVASYWWSLDTLEADTTYYCASHVAEKEWAQLIVNGRALELNSSGIFLSGDVSKSSFYDFVPKNSYTVVSNEGLKETLARKNSFSTSWEKSHSSSKTESYNAFVAAWNGITAFFQHITLILTVFATLMGLIFGYVLLRQIFPPRRATNYKYNQELQTFPIFA